MKEPKHRLHHIKSKKALYSLILIGLVLIGAIVWLLWPHSIKAPVKTTATTESTSSHLQQSTRKSTTNQTQAATKESTHAGSAKDTPYALTPEQIQPEMTFQLAQPDSPNMPTYVILHFDGHDSGKAEIIFERNGEQDVTADEKFTLHTVPTKELRIFPALHTPTSEQDLRSSVREVKVNTELTLQSGDQMYLLVNGNHGISLVTKNFAGNVPDDLTDVFVESFEKKIYTQKLDEANKEKIAQYKKEIEAAFIAQQNYIDSLEEDAKGSVQTPQSAAVAKATELGISHPEDNELIQKALSEFHSQ